MLREIQREREREGGGLREREESGGSERVREGVKRNMFTSVTISIAIVTNLCNFQKHYSSSFFPYLTARVKFKKNHTFHPKSNDNIIECLRPDSI